MSVQTQLDRLNGLRVNCVDAVTQMGGTISNTAKYEDIPAAIKTIKGIANAVPTLPTANGIETQIARKKAITDACKQMIIASGGTMPNMAKMADVPTGILSIPKGAEASTSPKLGVEYSDGFNGLNAKDINEFAKAISNNLAINDNTEVVYVDFGDIHRKINAGLHGDSVNISVGNINYTCFVIGFNHDELNNKTAYGEMTATSKAGLTFQIKGKYEDADFPVGTQRTEYWLESTLHKKTLPNIETGIQFDWKPYVKSVVKGIAIERFAGSPIPGNTVEKYFLLSESEITGNHDNSYDGEGTQYVWYKKRWGQGKYPGIETEFDAFTYFWTRSKTLNENNYFCYARIYVPYNMISIETGAADNKWAVRFAFCV